MSIPAEDAIRQWVNARTFDLVGAGNPLSAGAFLREQRSPAYGAYAFMERSPETPQLPIAEDGGVTAARIQCEVRAGTEQAAEVAAAALRTAFETLTGCPQWCGATGIRVLVADNHLGPVHLPLQPDAGELYSYMVTADFLLTG